SLGLLELRRAITGHMKKKYGVAIAPDQVIVTPGTSNALWLSLAVILNPGDEVIMADPHYPCYPNFVSFLGGKPVYIPICESENFQLSPERVASAITDRTKAILINSPANPTGAVLERGVMEKIAKLGPLVISDEIYHGLVYEGEAASMLEFTDNAIVIDGFSKRAAMTGWRLGYAIVPDAYVRPVQKLQQNFNISTNSFVQWAGISAIRECDTHLKEMRKTFDKRRKFLVDGLRKIGLKVTHPPKGAFYVFVNAAHVEPDSLKLANEILETAKVAVTPGVEFGEGGEGFIRLSYASSMENLQEGLNRLEKFIKTKG
ncbi:Valine--pyruvate aminotransferase, partial [hydrothermal vent metagenome]